MIRNLESPHERQKRKQAAVDSQLSELFKKGELTKVEMYSRLLEVQLHDAENAEYPSERSRATGMIMEIHKILDEEDQKAREKERDSDVEVAEKVDAVLLGCSYDQIDTAAEKMGQIENAAD